MAPWTRCGGSAGAASSLELELGAEAPSPPARAAAAQGTAATASESTVRHYGNAAEASAALDGGAAAAVEWPYDTKNRSEPRLGSKPSLQASVKTVMITPKADMRGLREAKASAYRIHAMGVNRMAQLRRDPCDAQRFSHELISSWKLNTFHQGKPFLNI